MTQGTKAGLRALVLLLLVGAAAYFTIFAGIFSFIKRTFWG